MLKVEKIQMKEALIITYKTDTGVGKMSLRKDHKDFEETKFRVMTHLTSDGCKIIECKDVLYITDDQLQEYLK